MANYCLVLNSPRHGNVLFKKFVMSLICLTRGGGGWGLEMAKINRVEILQYINYIFRAILQKLIIFVM